jgi:hypothetical protein
MRSVVWWQFDIRSPAAEFDPAIAAATKKESDRRLNEEIEQKPTRNPEQDLHRVIPPETLLHQKHCYVRREVLAIGSICFRPLCQVFNEWISVKIEGVLSEVGMKEVNCGIAILPAFAVGVDCIRISSFADILSQISLPNLIDRLFVRISKIMSSYRLLIRKSVVLPGDRNEIR